METVFATAGPILGVITVVLLILIFVRQKNCDEQRAKDVLDAERRIDNIYRTAMSNHFEIIRKAIDPSHNPDFKPLVPEDEK